MTAPIVAGLVACGSSKLDHAAPARQLYTGNLFRAAAGHAEATCDVWWILSARHGLVHPDTVLEPYDLRLDSLCRDDRAAWTARVDFHLRLDDLGDGTSLGGRSMKDEPVTVRLFAGETYRRPLLDWWQGSGLARQWTIEVPLAGLGIGEQLRWYKLQAEAREIEASATP